MHLMCVCRLFLNVEMWEINIFHVRQYLVVSGDDLRCRRSSRIHGAVAALETGVVGGLEMQNNAFLKCKILLK